ncbi:MAG: hypothetical protein R3E42_09380 [Burkholderiaceae bacterium]
MLAACGKKEEAAAPAAADPAPVAEAAAQACGKVTVANMNWQSAEVLANIDNIILSRVMAARSSWCPATPCPP